MADFSLDHYIGGRFQPSATGLRFDDPEPARGRLLCSVARGGHDDVDRAVAAATGAGPAWAALSAPARSAWLNRIADGIEARFDAFAEAEARDTGKPLSLCRSVDIPRAVANFRFFAGAILHDELGAHPMAGHLNYTLRRPVGVFGLISPWNLPLYLLSWKVAPALACGNTVVCKPSEVTPLSAGLLAELVHDLGLPAGVFNLVHGFGPEAGQRLVEHPDVPGISFTGGTATGRIVGATAAAQFKKLSLELGGKNASIVFADCDLEATIQGVARAAFANQGQICLCGSRVLVQRPLLERFTEGLAAWARARRIGDPLADGTDFGSLVSIAHRDKVEGYVALAQQEGGRIVCGGRRPADPALADGAFFEPTVLADLPSGCRTATEEIFGPVVTVHPFETEEEAVALANEVRYGLAGSVWTENLGRAHRVAAGVASGMIWVNCWLVRDLRVPFGGMKDSGVGREGGRHSLDFYSELRNVCVKL
jgi:aminomuconate-semialdehyde/2-hydroxymuconate-6-semialdehyde dehydrogenase